MADTNQKIAAFLNNPIEIDFTVTQDGLAKNLTGLHVKWALTPNDSEGVFDASAASIVVEKTNQNPGDFTDVDLTNGLIRVNIDDADTIALDAGGYTYQLEVFDSGGLNGVVGAEGVLTLSLNIAESV